MASRRDETHASQRRTSQRLSAPLALAGLILWGLLAPATAGATTANATRAPVPAGSDYLQSESATPHAVTDEASLTACLLGEWRHSHEEDTDERIVYRPADYPFPPSRGRVGFEFLAAGYLIFFGIDPADGESLSPGHWELLSDQRLQIEVNEPEQPRRLETLTIIACREDRLELAR